MQVCKFVSIFDLLALAMRSRYQAVHSLYAPMANHRDPRKEVRLALNALDKVSGVDQIVLMALFVGRHADRLELAKQLPATYKPLNNRPEIVVPIELRLKVVDDWLRIAPVSTRGSAHMLGETASHMKVQRYKMHVDEMLDEMKRAALAQIEALLPTELFSAKCGERYTAESATA